MFIYDFLVGELISNTFLDVVWIFSLNTLNVYFFIGENVVSRLSFCFDDPFILNTFGFNVLSFCSYSY